MQNRTLILVLNIVCCTLFFARSAYALTAGVEKLVEYETKANAASVRSSEVIMLPHVEIPLEFVGIDFAKRLDSKIADSLIIEKNGVKYVRWILNPEDTKWGSALITHFKDKGLFLERQYYFKGYQTASRSYIAEDPANGAQFSVKSSTNVTGGAWRDKKQPIGEAIDGRLMSDFLYEQNQKRPFENFIFMDEPAILKIEALDQAVVVRDLGLLKSSENGHSYLPGFSALFDSVGKEIALKNGDADAQHFWTENYIKVAGKALGELAARTGIQFDSPHSQNFLIELDGQLKPTGKLVLRDMSDLYIDVNYMKALLGEKNKVLGQFTQTGNKLDRIAAGFGPLHGNSYPSWVTNVQYKEWMKIFFSEFEQTFKNISGYDLAPLDVSKTQNGDYFKASYKLNSAKDFTSLFKMMKSDGVVTNNGGRLLCRFLFTGS